MPNPIPTNPAGLATTAAIAEHYEVTEFAVRKWILRGLRGVRLRAVRVGARYQIDPSDLQAFFSATTPTPKVDAKRAKKRRRSHASSDADAKRQAREYLRERGYTV